MELELLKEKVDCLVMISDTDIIQEEVCETIIPDSQPDVLRIIDTSVNIMLKSKEAEQGRVFIKGILQTSVIYSADDDNFYKVVTPIPFTVLVNKQEISDACAVSAKCAVISADTLISNSRKIVIRVNYRSKVCVYDKRCYEVCTKIENEDVYQKIEETELTYLSEYTEKTFLISDAITCENCHDSYAEILCAEYRITDMEYSISGSRVILRGNAQTDVTMLPSDSIVPIKLVKTSEFSQLIDVDESDSIENIAVNIMLTGCFCEVQSQSGGEEDRFEIEINAVAQCEIYRRKVISVLCDAYSADGDLILQKEELNIIKEKSCNIKTVEVSERYDNTCEIRDVISSRINFLEPIYEENCVKQPCVVTVYGLDKDASPVTMKQTFCATCGDLLCCTTPKISAINSLLSGGEIIFECSIIFVEETKKMLQINNISSCELERNNKWDESPSAVVYRFDVNDTLWDLSKKYRSSVETIIDVNKLEGSEIEQGRLLLIPKV